MATIDELRARAELIAEEQQIGGNTAERVGEAFDMVADIIEAVAPGDEQAVLYNPQSPNESQKAQARANIGAQETISDIADYVKVSAQTFTAAQKQQARENIGAEQAGDAVKNLAGSASDTETRIKAANNPNLQANVHLSGNNIYVNGIAGGIDLDNNGVNIKAGNSGYPNANVKVNGEEVVTKLYVDGKVDDRATSIEDALALIEEVIPSQASAQNQLADKNFVNSSISSSTANFVGTFDSLTELQAVQNPTNNDYGFVIENDAQGNQYYDRYKYNGTAWLFEYKVESTPFTAAQWAAIQSGITSALVSKLSALPTNAELTTSLDAKADKSDTYTKAQVDSALVGKQATLVSGQNIATINGNNLLNGGDIEIDGGSANGIKSIEQTTVSDADGGTNVVSVTLDDDTVSTLEIKNGSKGEKGDTVIIGGESPYTLYNATGNATDGAMTQAATTAAIKEVDDNVKEHLGGADVAFGEAVASNTGKYVNSSGAVANSSTATNTVAFFAIPANVATIQISIPKTGNSSSRPVSFAKTSTATSGLKVYSGGGNQGAQSYVVEGSSWSGYGYLVINYNSAGGVPTINGLTANVDLSQFTKEADLTGIEFTKVFTKSDCPIGKTYIARTTGEETVYNGFRCSDFIRIPESECLITTDFTMKNSALIAWYDSSKTYLGYQSGASTLDSYRCIVPEGAVYMRLSCTASGTMTIAFSSSGAKAVRDTVESLIAPPKSWTNILWLGNSFTADTLSNIGAILGNLGVDGVNINYINQGGQGFSFWDGNFQTTFSPSVAAGWSFGNGVSIENLLKNNDIDVIVLQQNSADADDYTTYVPSLASLIYKIRQASRNKDIKIALAMIWGTGDSTYADIVSATKQALDNHNYIDYLIPLGTAIESARISPIAEGNNGFSSNASLWHLASGFGEYVACCAFYAYMLEPLTHIPITEDTTTISVSGGLGELAVTAENRGLAHQFAINASIIKYTPVAVS